MGIEDVKKLREQTGAPILDCKNALKETNGDFDQATKLLKEKGLADAKKRAGKATKEGGVYIKIQDNKVAMIELNCETDFVARNEEFIGLSKTILNSVLETGDNKVEKYQHFVQELMVKTKENMALARVYFKKLKSGNAVTDYIHGNNKIGTLVFFEIDKPELIDDDEYKETTLDIAMHTAAMSPMFLNKDSVSQDYIKENEEIFYAQVKESGKPEKIIPNIVKGKINKLCSEICLVEQIFVKDNKLKISNVLDNLNKKKSANIKITEFVNFKLGQNE